MKTAYLIYCANLPNFRHFPESSLALAGELKKMHIPVKIIDLQLVKESSIRIDDPLFFGFTISSNESIKFGVDFARKLKKLYPGVPFAWGGPHVHMMPEQTASHELVDLACYGEGELTVRELARQLDSGALDLHKIPGIVFREDGRIHKTEPQVYKDLDELTFNPYELLDQDLYKKTIYAHFYYQTSRGCVHNCRFCSYNYQHRWRGKSSRKVIGELKKIVEHFKPYEFCFTDGNFFASKQRALEILRGMKAMQNRAFKWYAFCRFDDMAAFSDEMLELMRDTGCSKINFGGESGSDTILEYLNKKIAARQIIDGVARCNKYGIQAEVSFIAGLPPETEEDLNKTIDLILTIYKMHPDNMVNGLYYYQPYPNTPLVEEISRSHRIPFPETLEHWGIKPLIAPYREYLPWLSDEGYQKIFTLTQIINYLYLRKRLEINLRNKVISRSYNVLFRLSSILLPFVRLRLEGKNFVFPYEWKLYDILRKKMLHISV